MSPEPLVGHLFWCRPWIFSEHLRSPDRELWILEARHGVVGDPSTDERPNNDQPANQAVVDREFGEIHDSSPLIRGNSKTTAAIHVPPYLQKGVTHPLLQSHRPVPDLQ